MSQISRTEAKLLKERSEKMDRKGGGLPLAAVESRMRAGMIAELHRIAHVYDGRATRAKRLLDAMLTAQEEGIPEEAFANVTREAAAAFRQRAA